MNADQIALQLYTVRARTAADMLGTLRRLAEIGYRAVEFAGYGGAPVKEIRATLDEVGMRAIAAHVSVDDFERRFDEVIEELTVLGCEHAIVPAVPHELRGVEQVATLAPALNQWGKRCADAGLRFGYHNHDFEFERVAGRTMFDALVDATDPALVSLELDIGWAEYAGVDAAGLLRRLAGRTPLAHVKDMTAGPDRVDAPFGEGDINWAPIFAAAREAGTEWCIIEQDRPRDPLTDVATSLRNLSSALGAT